MHNLSKQSIIKVVPNKTRKDKRNYIVEDCNTGEYYEFPKAAITSLELLKKGYTLVDAEIELKKQFPHEEIDMIDFVEQLLEMNLVEEIDGISIAKAQNYDKVNGFMWVPQKLGKFAFNKLMYLLYSILFLICLSIFLLSPDMLPHYKDIFILESLSGNILLWLGISIVLLIIHELGHILAIRAFNLSTRLEIGNRLMIPVLETDMSQAWGLPPKERNVLYLAGFSFDVLMLTLAIFVQIFFVESHPILLGICRYVVLDVVLRTVFQCCVYMKTDFYYLIENNTGCYNLMENTLKLLKSIFSKETANGTETIYQKEKGTLYIYSVMYVVGVVITIVVFLVFFIPQILYISKMIVSLYKGTGSFFDTFVLLIPLTVGMSLVLYSLKKKKRNILNS
ncbi:hypothetical protein [Bacillus sp. EB01]|uniref:hypothetical protein n=1 Tax=Bacillus sp. EB01 TaxID=1347086 RepID=UPI0005C5968A|nr:hypothetical protein [Bacillus sp. EB01]